MHIPHDSRAEDDLTVPVKRAALYRDWTTIQRESLLYAQLLPKTGFFLFIEKKQHSRKSWVYITAMNGAERARRTWSGHRRASAEEMKLRSTRQNKQKT